MIIVAVNATSRLTKSGPVNTIDLEAVLVLTADNAKFGELVLHGLDTVAFLDTLVCNAINASGVVRAFAPGNSSKDRGSKESICHWLHVHIGQGSENAISGSSDSGGVIQLLNCAAHGPQHVNGELSVTLQ